MSITVESTTDTPEAVTAAIGGKKAEEKPVEEKKSAAPATEKIEDAETAEESETSEIEGEEQESEDKDESEDGEKKPKRKGGYQRRVDKLTREREEARREAAELRAQIAAGQKPAEKPEPKSASGDSEKPKPEDFDTHADYISALVKHERKLEKAADAERERQESVRKSAQKNQEEFSKRLQTFKDSHDDFDEALEEVDDVKMPLFVHDAIVESEIGPEVMYELAKNREELERICALSPLAAARAIGKIEARLSSKPAKEETPVKKTQAPPPLKPVGSKASVGTKNPDDMNFQEYKKWREGQTK